MSWSPPDDDGGCAITGYALLIGDEKDATASGEIPYTEVHSAEVRDEPNLSAFSVTAFPAGTVVGANLRFKLIVFNQGGFSTTSSNSTRVELAGVPDAPTSAPARDHAITSGSVIRVTYSAPPSDGGSPLTSYEVQMDDGLGGGFSTVAGGTGQVYLKTYFIALGSGSCNYTSPCTLSQVSTGLDGQPYSETVTTMGLTKGLTYRFRYRAGNSIGWGEWSPASHVQAAKAPEPPQAPTVITTGSDYIDLQVNPSLEHNGDPITRYGLYIDAGTLDSAYSAVTSYSDSGNVFRVTLANGSMTSGEKYRFVTTATNTQGESAYSAEVRAAVGLVPSQPAKLARSFTLSTRTQLTITWTITPDTEIPITGYVLEWDNAEGDGNYYELWNGRGRPEVLSYTVTVNTGSKYSFRHKAVNYNGDSVYSDVLETYACVSPTAPGTPTWITSTTTSISVSWTSSVDDGGCPIIEYSLYRDAGDGSGTAVTRVHAAELAGNSEATSQIVTEFPASSLGLQFVFLVKVHTAYTEFDLGGGVAGQASAALTLAGVPAAPAAAPTRGTSSGSATVHVDFAAVTQTNGAAITSYIVEIDDGLAGSFVELQGLSAPSLSLTATKSTGVVQGRYYRVRYSAQNEIGVGPVSPVAYILAADVPDTV